MQNELILYFATSSISMKGPVKSSCICIMLRRAASSITEMYDNVLKDVGITVNQFSIMANLNKLGTATTTELADYIGLDRSTLVRNLKPIMAMGYINDISGKGERNNQLRITSSGIHLLEKARPLWQMSQDNVGEYLGKDNLDYLMEMLFKLQTLK